MTAYDKYRAKMSVEEEDRLVDIACKATELQNKASPYPPCQAFVGGGPFFRPNPPAKDAGPWKGRPEEHAYKCWQTLPTLSYGKTPGSFLGDTAAREIVNSPVQQCREQARARIQIERAIAPDARFWVGVGAAGLGVLVAFTAKLVRRR
jgi:hypothetical protein